MENRKEKKAKKVSTLSKLKAIDWSKPANKWKAVFALLGIFVVFIGFTLSAMAATNSTEFCGVCHEMAPERSSHAISAHKNVRCITCHVPPDGPVMFVYHKVKALKEVYYHVVGLPNPIHQHEHEAVPDRTCLQEGCHTLNDIQVGKLPSGKNKSDTGLILDHSKHVTKRGIGCIFCHSGVAHGKLAERDLLTSDQLKYYDKNDLKTAGILITDADRKPNMGTCIECHTRVNNGQKPYEDINYALPYMEPKKDHTEKTKLVAPKEFANVNTEVLQNVLKQSMGLASQGKISMECSTCHTKDSAPNSHADSNFMTGGHGALAFEDVQKCINCHKDQNWIRRLPQSNVKDLLKAAENKKYVGKPNVTPDQMSKEIQGNAYCSTCHGSTASVPENHKVATWSISHSYTNTNTLESQCKVCHYVSKPAKEVKGMSKVYCEKCHGSGVAPKLNIK
ncbi:MAG: NapC/NirT cytochrome c domain protein [Bacillales bacterium]|nr:NapC/NirT cytochrome c domain protein [Bacillales bacterium]